MVSWPVRARTILRIVRSFFAALWRRFRLLPGWVQGVIGALAVVLVIAFFAFIRSEGTAVSTENHRFVTLRPIAELSGAGNEGSVLGSVRSRAEAEILAETGGTVRRVNTTLGARVPAGFVIAELENSAERAAVLQAEGAYDSAVAARNAVSPIEVSIVAKNAYRDAFVELDTMLESDIALFFGGITPYGPDLLINPIGSDATTLSRERDRIDGIMDAWRTGVAATATKDPGAMLSEAETSARAIAVFVDELAKNTYALGSDASAAQRAGIASAQADMNSVLASLSSARSTYQSGATASTASVDAGVKSALGNLRLAQSALEKTQIRAPIAGVVNFLPIRASEYITPLSHVATVAENTALEIVAYVSEDDRANLSVGTQVAVDGQATGIITSIAPALDPVTKQIEVRIAIEGESTLVNGQSVRIALPNAPEGDALLASGPLYLPLASVKLRSKDRVVFTVDADSRLSAIAVTTGEVRGDAILILTSLSSDLIIVSDARGLAEGEKVEVAP